MANVELESQQDGRAELHYTVADTGVGIPPEKLDGIGDQHRLQRVDRLSR